MNSLESSPMKGKILLLFLLGGRLCPHQNERDVIVAAIATAFSILLCSTGGEKKRHANYPAA